MKIPYRKIIFIISLVLSVFVIVFTSACKEPEDPGSNPLPETVVSGNWTFELNADNTYSVEKYEGNETTITVPTLCEGKTVTKILTNAFNDCTAKSITLPSSIEKIEMGAFSKVSDLEELTIPFVGGDVSYDDSAEITLFGYVFGKTPYIDSIGVSQPLLFGAGANPIFYIPQSLKKVTITGGKVYYGAFSSCVMLEEVNLPQSDTDINSFTFEDCVNLKTVTIPEGVTRIGERAFVGCVSLVNITLPHSLETLDTAVFEDCESLKTIEIPERLTNVEYDNEIGGIFKGCTSLTSITVSPNNTAFSHFEGVVYNKEKTKIKIMPLGYSGPLTLPETITTIDDSILSDLNECLKVNYIWFDDKVNAVYESVGGILYNKDKTEIVAIPRALGEDENDSEVVIESGIQHLPLNAFEYCVNIKKITLPEGVKSIPQFAFAGCTSLQEVVIPESVTYIGTYAFANCTSLETFIVTRNVITMGQMAFSGNKDMKLFIEYTREEIDAMIDKETEGGVEDTNTMWEPYWLLEFEGKLYYVGEWLRDIDGNPYPILVN